jgi:hypothetical protein
MKFEKALKKAQKGSALTAREATFQTSKGQAIMSVVPVQNVGGHSVPLTPEYCNRLKA